MTRRDLVAQSLVVAVAVVGAGFIFSPGMLHGHDMPMHLFRLEALDDEIHNGVLYPRWVDNFVFGYGYPVFLFYSPLTYYVGEAFHLVGLTFVDSFKVVAILARVVGGLGTYYLGRDTLRSRPAGLIAAIAFLLASYQYTDLVERVAIPELIEMNLLPAALWAINRVVARRTARNIAFGAVVVALLVLAHQTTAMASAILLGAFAGFLLVRTWLARREVGHVRVGLISLASVATLGVLLSAFFWLPAWVVRGDVPLESMPPGLLPFSDELLNLPDLVQRNVFYVYPFPSFVQLNPVEIGLAIVGLVLAFAFRPVARPFLAFFALFGTMSAVGMTTLGRPIWDQLPILTLMQFPFRLEMYLSLATALLTGAFALFPWRGTRVIGSFVIVAILAGSTIRNLDTSLRQIPTASISTATFARLEMSGKWAPIGTTVPTQFLPKWVQVPAENLPLSPPVAAISGGTSNLNATVQVLDRRNQALTVAVVTDRPFEFRYHGFYFPGWVATVDGRAVTVGPAGPEALLSFSSPVGNHVVKIDFGTTPIMLAATSISLVAVVFVVFLFLGRRDWWRARRRVFVNAIVAAAVAALPIAATAAVAEQGPSVHPTLNQFSACLQLAGWESRGQQRTNPSVLDLTLYWFSRCDLNADQEVAIELLDPTEHSVVRYHRQPRWGTMPMSTWYSGELIRDLHEIVIPGGLSGGQYDIVVGLNRPGDPVGKLQPVGSINLPAGGPDTPESLPVPLNPRPIDFAGGLSLVGWKAELDGAAPRQLLRPGDTVTVSVLTRARDEVAVDGVVSVFLADYEQRKYSPRDSYPPSDFLFTAAWWRGETHLQGFTLPVPDNLTPGSYDLAVEMYDFGSGSRLGVLGDHASENPSRAILQKFKVPMPSQPPPTHRMAQTFAGQIVVDGYDDAVTSGADPRTSQIELDVHWRAIHNQLPLYHSFVHVYDHSGKLVAQSDGPVGGLPYPSNIWDANDTVIDRHTIVIPPDLAPGAYAMRAGLYLPVSGNRVAVDGAGDSVELGTLVVERGSGAQSLRVLPESGA